MPETNREPGTVTETNPQGDGSSFADTSHFENLPDEIEVDSNENPEPALATETEEQVETQETEEATEETPTEEETGDEWLPAEQAKQFPLDTLVEFAAKRGYGLSKQDIENSPGIQKMLRDKLNTDIEIKRLREAEPTDVEEEPNPFEEPETEEAPATAVTPVETDPVKLHYQLVDNLVNTIDKSRLEEWGREVMKAYGIDTDVTKLQQALANPRLTPEQRADITQAISMGQAAGKLAQTQARGVVDILMTLLPQVLPAIHEQLYPGTAANWERQQMVTAASGAWAEVREAVGKDGKGELPAWGTPEMRELVTRAETQLGLRPGAFASMKFSDNKGRPLSQKDTAREIYRMVAQVARGQRPNPAAVATAVETGRKQQRETEERRRAGKAMGAGVASRAFTQPKTGDGMRDALRSVIAEDEAESQPFSHPKWKEGNA